MRAGRGRRFLRHRLREGRLRPARSAPRRDPWFSAAGSPAFGGQLKGCRADPDRGADRRRIGLVNKVKKAEVSPGIPRLATLMALRVARPPSGWPSGRSRWDIGRLPAERMPLGGLARAHCFSTEDQKEGMKVILEKRKPQFRGRVNEASLPGWRPVRLSPRGQDPGKRIRRWHEQEIGYGTHCWTHSHP